MMSRRACTDLGRKLSKTLTGDFSRQCWSLLVFACVHACCMIQRGNLSMHASNLECKPLFSFLMCNENKHVFQMLTDDAVSLIVELMVAKQPPAR